MPLLPNAIKQAIEDVTAELRRRYEPPVTEFPAGPQPLTIHDIAGPENRARGIYPQGARGPIVPSPTNSWAQTESQGVQQELQNQHAAYQAGNQIANQLTGGGYGAFRRWFDRANNPNTRYWTQGQPLPIATALQAFGALGTGNINLPQESPQNPTGLAPEPGAGRYLGNLGKSGGELLSSAVGEIPSPVSLTAGKREVAGLPYFYAGLKLGKPKPVKEQNAATQFVYQMIPYIVSTGVGTALFAASLPAAVRDEVEAYQRGEIDVKQLAGNLALTLGPLIAPELAKLGIKGAKAAGEYARSPKGRATINNVLTKIRESSPEGGGGTPLNPGGEPVKPGEQPKPIEPPAGPEGNLPEAPVVGEGANLPAPPETPPLSAQERAGGAEPPRGGEPPVGGELPQRPPTIPEIEARSAPLTPEQRAKLPRDQQEAFYVPGDFAATTADTARAGEGPIGGTLQKIQDAAQKVPLIRSLFSFAEPMAAARAQTKLGNLIPEAMVRREVYIADEQQKAGAAFMKWLEDNRATLDINGKGIARGVGIRADAEIPASLRGRIDHITEHPEKYVLSPEQTQAITELRHTFNAITQGQLDAGVDVREVMGAYFPRIVKKSPKGAPRAKALRLTSKPGHAKPRQFADIEDAAKAGYEYVNPIEAVQHRIDTGIESIGNRRTLEGIKELGQKPSERVPQSVRDRYLAAKEAYKTSRTAANEKALEQARRDLRVMATKANEPRIGEAKAFGRIFPEEVTKEMAKYADIEDPGSLDTFFRIQRATATSSDLSAWFVQGGNLFWRNNIAFWKAAGYSVAALAKAPMGYVSRNIDVINRGIDAGAIRRPSEFLLSEGGGAVQHVGRLPIIKQAQRSFEWFVFIGQSEWWKAAERLAKTPAERAELAAVIRKGTGSMLRPGLTKMQQRAEVGTFFAGRFLMAVNGLAADAMRGGIRGAEARKTLGMVFGGATAMTIAAQLATDGTMPNLTDPSNRDKPWLSVKRPGGTLNFYGPLYPYLKAYASVSQNLANGKPSAAADDALFLARSRLSIQYGTLIDFIEGQDVVGNTIDLSDPKSVAAYFARRTAPIGLKQIVEGGIEGQRTFPEGNLQIAGLRANPATDFRQKINAAEKYLATSKGDFRTAYDAAIQANDSNAADGIKYQWRNDFERRAKPLGLTVTPGVYDPATKLSRAPLIQIASVDTIWKTEGWEPFVAKQLAESWDYPGSGSQKIKAIAEALSGHSTLVEARKAFVDAAAPEYTKLYGVTLPVARDDLAQDFDSQPQVKQYEKAKRYDRLAFWREHPDLLYEAWLLGLESDNADERKIISEYEKSLSR